MGRRPRIDRDIGPELVAARARGVPWKYLMRQYGLGRTQLWEYWRRARSLSEDVPEHLTAAQPGPQSGKDVYKHLGAGQIVAPAGKDVSKHLSAGQSAVAHLFNRGAMDTVDHSGNVPALEFKGLSTIDRHSKPHAPELAERMELEYLQLAYGLNPYSPAARVGCSF